MKHASGVQPSSPVLLDVYYPLANSEQVFRYKLSYHPSGKTLKDHMSHCLCLQISELTQFVADRGLCMNAYDPG